jgi:uncharacterized hydrophobic protein (TIGR00271 family)
MRQIMIQTGEQAGRIVELAAGKGAMNVARIPLKGGDDPGELIVAQVPNSGIGALIDELQELTNATVTLIPQGTIPLRPPATEAPEQVKDVTPRSPIEIFLSGLQSIGSWKGFLLYAVAGGTVAWIGLYTNTIYLLVAAMLIAPFAGPAMNAAMGTAKGDWPLLRQGLVRYFSSLALAILVSAALSLLMRQEIATSTMVEVSQVSIVAILLALTAGAAGASNLIQSERNSLVSGAAVGMLVAASLAPPASMIGMSLVIGRWGMAMDGMFLVMLHLAGINLAGALTFRLYGLSPKGIRYPRGYAWVSGAAFSATVLLAAGLLALQLWSSPALERSTIATRAEQAIQEVVDGSGAATLIEATARFTRPSVRDRNMLLCVVYVHRSASTEASSDIRLGLTEAIRSRLLEEEWEVAPVIDVRVLSRPGQLP